MSIPIEIERKFVIEMPDTSVLSSLPGYSSSDIEQTYLSSDAGVTRRVRARKYKGCTVYTETKKMRIDNMSAHEDEREITRKEYETVAWHEAGHALVQLLLPNGDPLHKVSIIPRGRALGVTMSLPDRDVLNRTRAYFLDELAILPGGRIPESMHTGEISTGAASDIAMATETARAMVCRYGMSDAFGFQTFVEPNAFAVAEAPPAFSQKTAEAIDAEVKRLVDEGYARAKKLLEDNRDKLELLATTLLERETMDGRDVEKLLGIQPRKDKDSERKDEEHDVDVPPAQD